MKILLLMMLFVGALFGADLDWNHDYKKALEQAKIEKKDVYMLITSANCRWCRKFEATTLQDEAILQRLKKQYVLLHIDRDEDYMPEHFKKKRVPRHYFLRAGGEVIYSFLGYWANEDFASFLHDVDKRRIKQDNK
ncbi:thioredoxin family protein [bacterium]|nr:thioredoxin family protein [bacterium]MBU1435714.1 thioredoxin family protein [bacterium]MBU1502362.1 thioredoxin family protein [bacterium]